VRFKRSDVAGSGLAGGDVLLVIHIVVRANSRRGIRHSHGEEREDDGDEETEDLELHGCCSGREEVEVTENSRHPAVSLIR